jgi:hypothetical protein
MRRAAKVDSNQAEMVEFFRKCGASVQILSQVGAGFPDVLIGYGGRNYLVELKSEIGKLTPDQVKWHNDWRGHKTIIRGIDEAIKFLRDIK